MVLSRDKIIEPAKIKDYLLSEKYLIAADLKEPGNLSSLIIENVICIKKNGIPNRISIPVLVIYTVTDSGKGSLLLHDDTVTVLNDSIFHRLIKTIQGNYMIFLKAGPEDIESGKVYGKLGTEYENQIVYEEE
ncbi:MAG: hypothetical protein ACI4SE_04445 [Lachnospiraceae bacterium]